MAKDKLKQSETKTIKFLLQNSEEIEESNIQKPSKEPPFFVQIQLQRHGQKKILFRFTIISSILILISLAFAVFLQAYFRATQQKELFANFELQILSGAVFAQLIGTINIIATKIWDETPFTKLLAEDLRNKAKKESGDKL